MKQPEHNDDPYVIADWIYTSGFPLSAEEHELILSLNEKKYSGEAISVWDRYEVVILYWQTVGYFRGRD